jgi:O-acetyl-ADP-ribose deacetylase (regulator of RNase III)
VKTMEGDLIKLAKAGEFDVIVHGCNCFCTMGKGIAKAIKAAFPAAYEADRATEKGDRGKLGTCSIATCEVNGATCTVVNAYTQFNWRGRGVKADYDAIRSCMRWVAEHLSGNRIGLPKIGAGLAGGDWALVEQIIDDELGDEDVTLVTLPR